MVADEREFRFNETECTPMLVARPSVIVRGERSIILAFEVVFVWHFNVAGFSIFPQTSELTVEIVRPKDGLFLVATHCER